MPIIDCLAVAEKKRLECDLTERACLHIIQIGENPVNELYLKSKITEAEKWNVFLQIDKFDKDVPVDYILDHIRFLNYDKSVDGIIIQLPTSLSKTDEEVLICSIAPKKNVDGFDWSPFTADDLFTPCTPQGIMWLLEDLDYEGKTIGIIGRGKLVGCPLISMLRDKKCTLVLMNSSTTYGQKEMLLPECDIIVSGIGKPNSFDVNSLSYYTQYVIDAGISRLNKKQVGDFAHLGVESEPYKSTVHYTPWVNGVGKLTVAALMHNVRKAHERNS